MGTDSVLTGDKIIVFFDTRCLLCSRFVNILLKYDKQKLYYSGFDSQVATVLLPRNMHMDPETVILAENGTLFEKSEAVIRLAGYLQYPWPLLKIFRVWPLTWRNRLYDWVATNRNRWFGRSSTCYLPDAEVKNRFFD